jgi:hypothetical protein
LNTCVGENDLQMKVGIVSLSGVTCDRNSWKVIRKFRPAHQYHHSISREELRLCSRFDPGTRIMLTYKYIVTKLTVCLSYLLRTYVQEIEPIYECSLTSISVCVV